MSNNISNQTNHNRVYNGSNPVSTTSGADSAQFTAANTKDAASNRITDTATSIKRSNPAVNMASDFIHSNAGMVTALTIPTYAGFYAAQHYANKALHKDYDKTYLSKMGKWGDSVAESGLYKNTIGKVSQFFRSTGGWINEKVIQKSNILRAFTTPARAEWEMARSQSAGARGFSALDITMLMDDFVNAKTAGLPKNATAAEIAAARDAISHKYFGFDSAKLLEIKSNPVSKESTEMLHSALQRAASTGERIQIKKLFGFLPQPGFLNRDVPFQELLNKHKAMNSSCNSAKSGLGKLLPKLPLSGLEGSTCGAFGGKLVILLGAIFMAQAMNESRKAEKGDKIKRFAEELVSLVSFLVTIPLAAITMYGIGGLKYTGMSKEQVKAYHTALDELNKKNLAGGFANKEAWKKAVKDVKKMSANPTKNTFLKIVHAPFRFIGKALGIGLDFVKPYKHATEAKTFGESASRFASKAGGFTKAYGGGISRIIIGMMVLMPFFSNIAVKGSHLIFGKPKKSILDEGKEETPKESNPQMSKPNSPQAAQFTHPTARPAMNNKSNALNLHYPQGNLVDFTKRNALNNGSISAAGLSASADTKKTAQPEITRTYIPSDEPVQIVLQNQEVDVDQKLASAYAKSNYAIKHAEKFTNA